MPVVIHWTANCLLGLFTARMLSGAPGLHTGRAPWPLLFLGVLQAVFITPSITYLFIYWTAWSTFYLFEPSAYPLLNAFIGPLSAAVVCVNFVVMWLGFVCGRASLKTRRKKWLLWPVFVCAATAGLCIAYAGERIAYAGDTATFWRGEAPLWLSTAAGRVGLFLISVSAAFLCVLRQRYAHRDPVFLQR